MITVVVRKYLSPMVKDNDDPLAIQTRTEVREVVKAKGKLRKFEVTNGVIFINVDVQEAADAVKTMFAAIPTAVTQEMAPLEAIFMKSQLIPITTDVKPAE